MKTKILSFAIMFVFGTFTVFAEEKKESVEVKGNCGMCEKRIEKAAGLVEGVSSADWDNETKKMAVVFDDETTSVDKIEMAVAMVGHDTPNHKASVEVYNKLPGCCKYDRTAEKKEDLHEGHQH